MDVEVGSLRTSGTCATSRGSVWKLHGSKNVYSYLGLVEKRAP